MVPLELKILVVEDNPGDVDLVRHMLSEVRDLKFGMKTSDTLNGAFGLLEAETFDVVLLDLSLPDGYGLTTFSTLYSRFSTIPVIVCSGYDEEKSAVEAVRLGAQDYLVKGKVNGPLLCRVMRYAIERNRGREALRAAHHELEIRVQERTADLALANEALRGEIAGHEKARLEIQSLNDNLERRVRERTAALTLVNAELKKEVQNRKSLEKELVAITEKERRRIGHDLHDDLGQRLTGISFMVKGLESKLKEKTLPEAADASKIWTLVDQTLTRAHGLARGLTAIELERSDLHAALNGLANHAVNIFAVKCRLQAAGALPDLKEGVVHQLYNIAQEAVSNAIKHGGADVIDIILDSKPHALKLEIRNNGRPFPDEIRKNNRMGLKIMGYRASDIGATLHIDMEGTVGPSVSCILPIKTKPVRRTSVKGVATLPGR